MVTSSTANVTSALHQEKQSKKTVQLMLNLAQLQNLIKRDPDAYKEEFLMQKRSFDNELEIFQLKPDKQSDRFLELVTFMSHVCPCYPDECGKLPLDLLQLLENQAAVLHPDVREKLFQSLVLMRNKALMDPLLVIKLSFRLFAINDKALRVALGDYIINDIKIINQKKNNDKLNRAIQAFLFTIVTEEVSVTAKKSVQILAELYRKKIWTDARTVNVLGSACLSPISKVMVAAVNFFLGIETKMHEDDEEEKTAAAALKINFHEHSKKTKKRQRLIQKAESKNSKLRKEQENAISGEGSDKSKAASPLFPAIQLLHDPQRIAEQLFKRLRQSGERFEVKVLLMNFVSRLIGCHRLLLLSFYSFIQRYLTSHQKDVTQILAYLIQACHELVPPDELLPVVKAIAYNFITERCSNEVLAVGLNAVREIFARVPALLREKDMGDFVQDLAMYGKKTHKSVMMAAHSIVNLVREVYPVLLRKGDRGKKHDIHNLPLDYGVVPVAEGVDGAELLEAYERGDIAIDSDDEVVWNNQNNEGDEDGDKMDDEEEDNEGDEEVEVVEVGASNKRKREARSKSRKAAKRATEEVEEEEEDDGGDGDDDEEEEEVDGEDGSDEGSWQDVSEDEDENGEGEDGSNAKDHDADEREGAASNQGTITSPQPQSRRHRVDAVRLLTAEDFALIRKLKLAQKEMQMDPKQRAKQKQKGGGAAAEEDLLDDDNNDSGFSGPQFSVLPESLAAGMRTGRTSKIERIRHVLEGRKEAGPRWEHEGHKGGLTNKEKQRKKNFVMVRKGKRSVANKIRKSNSDVRYDKMKHKEQYGRDRRKRRRT